MIFAAQMLGAPGKLPSLSCSNPLPCKELLWGTALLFERHWMGLQCHSLGTLSPKSLLGRSC